MLMATNLSAEALLREYSDLALALAGSEGWRLVRCDEENGRIRILLKRGTIELWASGSTMQEVLHAATVYLKSAPRTDSTE